jgi:hypothetical protein
MKSTSLKLLLLVASWIAVSPGAFGDSNNHKANPAPGNKEKSKSYFFSSLLPTALQSHPLLAISVITENSAEGKKLPPPTPEAPTYYFIKSMGYHHEGQGVSDEGKVSEENIQKLVQTALASSHYLPADPEHPATLALFYFWGVHSKLDAPDKETGTGGTPDINHHNLLSRAQLVGGTKFTHDFAIALDARDRAAENGPMGMDPVYLFSIRSDLNRSLVEQVLDDCYYIVVSAYDEAALAKNERKLIWRTKISTAAQGVSLAETTPALIASGGPYFGHDMNEPTIVDKRIDRKGKVGLGELKVISMDEKPAEKSGQEAAPTGKN